MIPTKYEKHNYKKLVGANLLIVGLKCDIIYKRNMRKNLKGDIDLTSLLLKIFVKNREDTTSPKVRAAYGILSGVVGIIFNALLCAGKLAVGFVSGSVSVIADAVNNLSDASSSVVTLIGFRLAEKPADEKHPFGYHRVEYFSGLAVAVMIVVIGIELIKTSIEKIISPEPVEFSAALVVVLVVSISVKTWMAFFNSKLGKKINSTALSATAADSRNDVIATAAVLACCIVGKLTGFCVDGYMGIAVALFIIWSGIGIAKDTISPLLGEAPDEGLVHSLAAHICRYDKILGIHDLIVHDYGPGRRFASVHVEIDHREDVLDAHELIDDIEREVKQTMNVDLVIHYDPVVTDDAELNEVREKVISALKKFDDRIGIHDFRMVRGTGHTNVIFDVVIPREYEKRTDELKKLIKETLKSEKMKYFAVVTFDSESFNDRHVT